MNADYKSRGIVAGTPELGLSIIGPNCLDGSSVLGQVHNAAMFTLEEKLVALEAKVSALIDDLALLKKAREEGRQHGNQSWFNRSRVVGKHSELRNWNEQSQLRSEEECQGHQRVFCEHG